MRASYFLFCDDKPKIIKDGVNLDQIEKLWINELIPYLVEKYCCYVMAHWVLYQIIVIFDTTCNTLPLTYGMYIKECLVCKYEAISLDNKRVGVYGRARALFFPALSSFICCGISVSKYQGWL